MRTVMRLTVALGLTVGCVAWAAEPETKAEKTWKDHVTLTLSDRVRGEFVDWFESLSGTGAADAQQYNFFANQLRVGAKVNVSHALITAEMQYTQFLNLPRNASLGAPQGNLGPGALYFFHTRNRDQGEPFLKQGNLTLMDLRGAKGLSATLGRFEYSDGAETAPADASLAWLKKVRISERLIGPFGYTHVTRSQDGARVVYDRPEWNVTALGSRPTQGGFELSANPELDIWLAGLALTLKQLEGFSPLDARGFYIYYRDNRDDPVKTENRANAKSDRKDIAIHTWGAHAITVAEAGPGKIDGLLWGAFQAGDWGKIDHRAWAYVIEAGYQLPKVFAAPWLRLGFSRTAGDDNANDSLHETFVQLIPTARVYAQTPFYNMMNNQDMMAQLVLKPHAKVVVRTDYHWLRLTEPADRWYAGGGATSKKIFGFTGIPSGGQRDLAHVVDFSASVAILKQLTGYAYLGHAFGQGVVKKTFAGSDLDYGYLELAYKY